MLKSNSSDSRNDGGIWSLLRERTNVLIIALFVVALAALLWHQSRQRTRLIESTTIDHAAQYSRAIAEFRTLYTSEVVVKANGRGVDVTHDYANKEGAIPLPATLSMLLGNRLAEDRGGGHTRLYSPYPFPWRTGTGGLRDDFARQAWAALNERSKDPYYRFEQLDGRPVLRYATADLMRQACVHCHNTHPDTPKSDWKEGDVRGVLEVAVPLSTAVALSRADLKESILVVLGLSLFGIVCVSVVVARLRRTSTELEQRVKDRTAELDDANVDLQDANRALRHEITERRVLEAEREELHEQLVVASRQAGMAEIASGVLHNVGNVLNSVNVSTQMLIEKVKRNRAEDLVRTSALFDEHRDSMAEFLADDPRGKKLPEFLSRLGHAMVRENGEVLGELAGLEEHVEHIKHVVNMQQAFATQCSVHEPVDLAKLVDDAVKMNQASLARHQVCVRRDYDDVPQVVTDKHKVMQILVNLVKNAKQAVSAAERSERWVRVAIERQDAQTLRVLVSDNGVGISRENLARIFAHGFTTKKNGHGFGLHIGALTAKELGGRLSVHSDGPERGATFTLELPVSPRTSSAIAADHAWPPFATTMAAASQYVIA